MILVNNQSKIQTELSNFQQELALAIQKEAEVNLEYRRAQKVGRRTSRSLLLGHISAILAVCALTVLLAAGGYETLQLIVGGAGFIGVILGSVKLCFGLEEVSGRTHELRTNAEIAAGRTQTLECKIEDLKKAAAVEAESTVSQSASLSFSLVKPESSVSA